MNNKLITLARILLKNGSGPGAGKKGRSQIVLYVILALCFAPLMFNIGRFVGAAYDLLVTVGQAGVILSLGISATAFIIFFFGIFYTMGTFYFSNDIENLLHLPLTPSQILGARFIVVTIYEYLTETVILAPILIMFGIKSGGGIAYCIYSIVVFLSLPVIPLVIASVITMVIMRFTNVFKNKDRFRTVAGIIALAMGISFNMVIQRSVSKSIDPKQLQDMFAKGNNSLVDLTSRIFPASRFAALGLTGNASLSGLLNILLFLCITVLAFYVFLYLGRLLYFKGVMGLSETFSRRKAISSAELEKTTVKNSVIKAFVLKEIKILFRTPAYFMNCVMMNFIWPIFIIIIPLTNSKGSGGLAKAIEYMHNPQIHGAILAIAFAGVLFISSSNGVTATSISREGQGIFVNKYLPMSYKDQLMAKIFSGMLISSIGMLSILIVGIVLFRIPVLLVILILASGCLAILFSSFIGIMLDLVSPKLNWDNEQKAVKQNLNLVFNMLICSAFAGLTILAVFKLRLDLLWMTAAIIVVFGLLDALLYILVATKGVKLLSSIEG